MLKKKCGSVSIPTQKSANFIRIWFEVKSHDSGAEGAIVGYHKSAQQKIVPKIVIDIPHHMGRPAASAANRQFAVEFARLVTRRTDCHTSTIARCGVCSIYCLLKMVRPSIIRDANKGPREGISEVEFNKALQVSNLDLG